MLFLLIDSNANYGNEKFSAPTKDSDIFTPVLEYVIDSYDYVFAVQAIKQDHEIWIDIDERESEEEVKNYLEENLPDSILSVYSINFNKRSLDNIR
ncbi:hypothetical protein WAK64_19600 [Bacillus spongiae]|uniref:Uncharacterized protein n=1 Tax=Bacillus spongiae TaxID=2683610 RepID=A0ABU8HJ22_9BACI